MKNLLLIFGILILEGCSQSIEMTTSQSQATKLAAIRSSAVESAVGITADELGLTKQDMKGLSIQERSNLLHQRLAFMEESNIPTDSDSAQRLGWIEADIRYKAFLQKNSQNPAIRGFRDKYSQVILTRYKLLNSNSYTTIAFYVKELIETNTQMLGTLRAGLTRIQGHIPETEFTQLVNSALILSNKVVERTLIMSKYARPAQINASVNQGGVFQGIVDVTSIDQQKQHRDAIASMLPHY